MSQATADDLETAMAGLIAFGFLFSGLILGGMGYAVYLISEPVHSVPLYLLGVVCLTFGKAMLKDGVLRRAWSAVPVISGPSGDPVLKRWNTERDDAT
jgi:hypothetical protein